MFFTFAGNLNVEHLGVVMRLFVQSLDGEAKKWFKGLLDNSINTWEGMENRFTQRWGEKRDHGYSLTECNAIKIKSDENISDFIKIFNNLYNNFPVEMKPPPPFGAKVVFAGDFEVDFSFTFRERRYPTLEQIQTDAL